MKPLVLVHGFMGGSGQWASQKPLERDRTLVPVDLPGFGLNAHLGPLDRIEHFSDWVFTDLSRRGIAEFDLMGHSMGGMIAQQMVRDGPDRVDRLILYATGSVGVLPGRFETIETSMMRARRDGAVATARRISATWFLDRENAAAYEACAAIAQCSGLPAILAGLDAMQAWSGQEELERIAARTLILWGDGDRTYPWSQIEMLWRGIPNSNLAVVPGCAHAVHMERPGLFNQIVGDFLGWARAERPEEKMVRQNDQMNGQ